jgi:hypothetical protein
MAEQDPTVQDLQALSREGVVAVIKTGEFPPGIPLRLGYIGADVGGVHFPEPHAVTTKEEIEVHVIEFARRAKLNAGEWSITQALWSERFKAFYLTVKVTEEIINFNEEE